jgi:hypothetical protein
MANILLVEDRPDLGLFEAKLLEREGHRMIWCGGGPTPFVACPMLKSGSCALADSADMVLFSCALSAPMRGRSYRADHLLNAYRSHPRYGKLPMVVSSIGAPKEMTGTGPYATVDKFSSPRSVVETTRSMLASAGVGRAGAER